jgi:histidinol dehydrogenase
MTVIRGLPQPTELGLYKVLDYVRDIVEDVRRHGDEALIKYTKKFDGVELSSVKLPVAKAEECLGAVNRDVQKALDVLYEFLKRLYEEVRPSDIFLNLRGVKLGIAWRAVDSVGIYTPGGRHPYPSTVLMAGVPAQVAGVKKIYVASPPNKEGCVDPAIIYTSRLIGASELYRVGGPQIIAAMAYGTESVRKVSKIVGPGNIYVQAAKFLVRGVAEIDGIEGPTELVVVADDSADPRLVVADMVAQAEHGLESPVVLITTSERVVNVVEKLLESHSNTFYIYLAKSVEEALNVANELAPEHLALHVRNSVEFATLIENAGAVSLNYSPPALIDYTGPNHILPTNRWARVRGALTIYDFLKPVAILEDASNIDEEVLRAVQVLAKYEGFKAHEESVVIRYV